jgi:large subunit ribosomal protein L10
MSKYVKELIATDLQKRLEGCRDILVVDSSLLDAVTNNNLRLKLRAKQITMLSVKNTLAKKALKELGLQTLDPFLKGPSSLVWGGPDIVELSKEISKWVRDLKKLEIKGGVVDGASVTAGEVDSISKGPSREQLIGKIVMLALSPGAQLCGALLGPGGLLAGQIKSIADKPEGEGPEGDAEAAPAA